jgi:hypothetical protein
MNPHLRVSVRSTLAAAVVCVCLAGSAASSAQSTKFAADQNRLHQEAAAARKAKNLELDDALAARYPASKFQPATIQKVAPGGSVSINLAGRLPQGVVILSERDGAALSGETVSAQSYSARLTVGPNEEPGFVRLWAYTPVSFELTSVPVAFIDRVYQFELKSANGYTVKVMPVEKTFTVEGPNATVKYQADFYKPGETKPFETMSARHDFSTGDEPHARLDLHLLISSASPEAEIDQIGTQLEDPKLTDEQRDALMLRRMNVQRRMIEEMAKGLQTDPASLNKKQDDFGCHLLQVYPGNAGAVKATVLCGKNFNGGALEMTGTMTAVR